MGVRTSIPHLASAVLAAMLAPSAYAAGLPDAIYDSDIFVNAGHYQGTSSHITQGPTIVDSLADADATSSANISSAIHSALLPTLSFNAFASSYPPLDGQYVDANTFGIAGGSVDLYYFFRIDGPSPSVPVLVKMAGFFSVRSTNPYQGGATISFNLYATDVGDRARVNFGSDGYKNISNIGSGNVVGSDGNFDGSISEDSIQNLQVGKIYTVDLFFAENALIESATYCSNYQCSHYGGGQIAINAFIDPYFSIAPGVANADAYSFEFSTGIGNSPIAAVPEPATWALMLVGFAGLAHARHRRERVPPTQRMRKLSQPTIATDDSVRATPKQETRQLASHREKSRGLANDPNGRCAPLSIG